MKLNTFSLCNDCQHERRASVRFILLSHKLVFTYLGNQELLFSQTTEKRRYLQRLPQSICTGLLHEPKLISVRLLQLRSTHISIQFRFFRCWNATYSKNLMPFYTPRGIQSMHAELLGKFQGIQGPHTLSKQPYIKLITFFNIQPGSHI